MILLWAELCPPQDLYVKPKPQNVIDSTFTSILFIYFNYWFFREWAFIGLFLLVYVPWLGIKCVTLTYQDDALTNWATRPELIAFLKGWLS